MSDERTATLEKQLVVKVTALEYFLIVFMSHREGHDAHEWIRVLLTEAVRNELHADLKKLLMGRATGDLGDDD